MKTLILKKLTFVLLLSALFTTTTFAHNGHDHDAPTAIKALKGGTIKALDGAYVEVVSRKQNIKIYFYDEQMKPKSLKDFKVSVTAENPKTKKLTPLVSESGTDHLEYNFDGDGLHRYTLKLAIEILSLKRPYDLSFVIEPRK